MARGDVLLVNLPASRRREQSGRRPVVAVQTVDQPNQAKSRLHDHEDGFFCVGGLLQSLGRRLGRTAALCRCWAIRGRIAKGTVLG